uniref:Uncharacterized protein n=1 Tax=Cyclophora tenuis TaxID=216820 RepID=A0A6U1S7H0_CYCTE|mmetsp:Transcript_6083/g.10608  ORF Transcript_6083/g.10608 Transcript_6083/m.10608 type:complete len:772 (+) Transcript_6083:674-2989(+)
MAAPTHGNVGFNEDSAMERPYTVFDAVNRHDLEGVVEEYVKNARNTIVSYLSMRRRWGPSRTGKEEKLDEYIQQLTDDTARGPSMASTQRVDGTARPAIDDANYCAVLRDMTELFAVNHPSAKKSSLGDTSVMAQLSEEGDRLIGQSVHMLSNSRPPNAFTVNCRSPRLLGQIEGPSIFDGSVANATPPPLGPPGIRPSGGSGTLLHLACAVDSPFSLAVALSLGADARSPHTAFRRLMIHEAACGGSINCLTLLLELGKECALDLYTPEELDLPIQPESPQSVLDLPFLPGSFDDSKQPFEDGHHPRQEVLKYRAERPVSPHAHGGRNWLKLLRIFFELGKKVRLGEMTELEAAREVLKQKTISESMKVIIAQSCSFVVKNSTITGNPFNSPWYSDGHGNTPLHWAAFKNECECVALLLQYHADPNARAHPSGWTALHDAAYSDSTESVELLLDAGADVDIPANSGATPLCFAAQEDSYGAARVLLTRGADLGARCAGGPSRSASVVNAAGHPNGRFSGYTPLHYCAHYNAHRAAKVLLSAKTAAEAMEIPDLSGRFPIHVAVARGSSDVLRELLHAGARVELPHGPHTSPRRPRRRDRSRVHQYRPQSPIPDETATMMEAPEPATPPRPNEEGSEESATPVSSPLLRSMIPARPVTSSKPWNCLSQRSIDECRQLISQAEQSWAPDRHCLFTPSDRRAVVELLRVGKRLEQMGTGIFLDLWPLVLSFCGRGWFEVEEKVVDVVGEDSGMGLKLPALAAVSTEDASMTES